MSTGDCVHCREGLWPLGNPFFFNNFPDAKDHFGEIDALPAVRLISE
jgi:hypothetical protein